MNPIVALFYDRMMRSVEEECLADWRRDLLSGVSGSVLEIGAGTGASLDLYPENIELCLSEPSISMRRQLDKKLAERKLENIKVLESSAEGIEANDASFDFVFASLVCCSVTDLNVTLQEIRRVLKPGGSFIFIEHVAAEKGSRLRKWQDRLNTPWRKLAGNCHLSRETESSICAAGFEIVDIQRENFPKGIPVVRDTIRGVALKS